MVLRILLGLEPRVQRTTLARLAAHGTTFGEAARLVADLPRRNILASVDAALATVDPRIDAGRGGAAKPEILVKDETLAVGDMLNGHAQLPCCVCTRLTPPNAVSVSRDARIGLVNEPSAATALPTRVAWVRTRGQKTPACSGHVP